MTIIALPATGHDHLADALVRRGFRRVHVDQPVRDFLTAVDPMVDQRTQFVNMGPGPRLSSKLSAANGEWARLDRDGKLGPEVQRLVENARAALGREAAHERCGHDVVLVGVTPQSRAVAIWSGASVVAIRGRGWEGPIDAADHLIDEGELIAQEAALVEYVTKQHERLASPEGMTEIKESWQAAGEAGWQAVKDAAKGHARAVQTVVENT